MGLFWDLYQQSQIGQHGKRAGALEERVERLETELERTQRLLHDVIGVLERHVGQDVDDDGRIA